MNARREAPAPPRSPRPVAAFFLSLAGSALVLGLLLLSDGRVLELKRAHADASELDRQIAMLRRQNQQLRASIASARRNEFPAERVAREELHLVQPEDLVLLYPPGSLSPEKTPEAGAPRSNPGASRTNPAPSPR
jgi:cell division protein FtsB